MSSTKSPNNKSAVPLNPVLISLVRRAMPGLLATELCGVQSMTGFASGDQRFNLAGIKQISDMVFEIYRGGERARLWLEETPLSCGIFREWVEKEGTFAFRVRYAGATPMGDDRYEAWRVEFHDEGEAALFKLTFL